MTPARRRLVLAALLLASAALVAWDRLRGPAVVEATKVVASATHATAAVGATIASAPTGASAAASVDTAPDASATSHVAHAPGPVEIAHLASRDPYRVALAEAAAAAAALAAAAPPPPPPAASAPPPPPVAPTPTWRVIGKGRVDGAWEVYVAQDDHVSVLHAGDRLDGQFEVVAIAPPTLKLLHLPTGQAQTVAIGGAFDE
jgi:hypothetical protein